MQIFVVDSDVAKSIVHIASDYGDRPDDERAAAALYGNYLGGDMSALLFQQIREARGYAYSVSGHVSTGSGPDDAWALTGSVETQTDKTIQALALYLELIAPPTDEGLDPVRVEVARAGLEASYRTERIDPRSLPETVLAWLREGFVEDPRPGVWSQFAALDAASLFERVQAWNGDHVLVGIVGNVDQLDMDGLSQLGQVTVVSADALFGYGEFPATAPE